MNDDLTESAKVWRDAVAEPYQSRESKIAAFEAAFPHIDLRRAERYAKLGIYFHPETEAAFMHFSRGWDEAIYAAGLSTKSA